MLHGRNNIFFLLWEKMFFLVQNDIFIVPAKQHAWLPCRTSIEHFRGFAIPASKHVRQLLDEIFVYSEDITPSPGYLKGWTIFKIDWPKFLFLQTKARTRFRRWWQLQVKSTTIKERYRTNFFFVVFRLFVFLPNWISNWMSFLSRLVWTHPVELL